MAPAGAGHGDAPRRSARPRPPRGPDGPAVAVAIFGESYLPYLSGVTVATEALADGLRAAGHRVLLAVPRPRSGAADMRRERPGPGPRCVWLPSYQGPPPALPTTGCRGPFPPRALRAARARPPDIVHAQSPFVSGLMARRVAGRRVRRWSSPTTPGSPTTATTSGRWPVPAVGPDGDVPAQLLGRLRRARGAGCDWPSSSTTASRAARGAVGRSCARSRPGIDVGRLRALAPVDPRPIGRLGAATAVVVVSVGRLAREKSVDLLRRGVRHGRGRAILGLRLLLVGGGPLRDESAGGRAARPTCRTECISPAAVPRLEALALARGRRPVLPSPLAPRPRGSSWRRHWPWACRSCALQGPGVERFGPRRRRRHGRCARQSRPRERQAPRCGDGRPCAS